MSFEDSLKLIVRDAVLEALRDREAQDDLYLLTAKQVAERCGFTDHRSVYQYRRQGKLNAVKLAKNTIRFPLSEVRRFMASLPKADS